MGPKTRSAVMERQPGKFIYIWAQRMYVLRKQLQRVPMARDALTSRECIYPGEQPHSTAQHTAQHTHTQTYSYTQRVSTPKETVIHRSTDNQRNSHVESTRISGDVIKEHVQTQGNSHTLRGLYPDVHTEKHKLAFLPERKGV